MEYKTQFPVFLDVRFVMAPYERMVFELFYDVAPFTAENFRALCSGEKGVSAKTGRPLGYKRSFFHPYREGDSYIKGGLVCYKTGECGESIYTPRFPADFNNLKHDKEGLLSMSRRDQEASNSCFVITLEADPSLDSSHVVFGKLVGGLDTLRAIRDHDFSTPVKIIDCGVLYNAKNIPRDVIMRPCCSETVSSDTVSSEGEQD
ncbi:peptidyl-prolyl cis-trans isomerase CYP95 isoform X2 [Neltuma alba]|uniref:peptidyl-prolyl cis-trans isomerase CYP95 isoform X2 n=1 Tax=Neltuma alba TaxID=207710 RepID=UPI0010A4512D|nr:peptidyl-prolyl cis-trans isomerase CYP95-like isoform X2 [Prosopis alba]